MTLTIHHLNNSRSQRILWLLEELEIPYELKQYQRDANTMLAPASLKEIHPLGKSPVITDGDLTLAESGAIVEYIINKYGNGRLQAQGEKALIENSMWSHYAEGSLMPLMVNKLIFSVIPSQAPFLVRPLVSSIFGSLNKNYLNPRLSEQMKYVSDSLGQRKWFADGDKEGNPTSADFQMLFPLEAAALGGRTPAPENIKNWVENVHSRPAYQRALEKGGKYAYA